jgi:hypothetical protein
MPILKFAGGGRTGLGAACASGDSLPAGIGSHAGRGTAPYAVDWKARP